MTEIEQLKQKETEIKDKLDKIQSKINNYWLYEVKKKYGIELGSIIMIKEGKKALITKIEPSINYDNNLFSVCIQGRVEKKDKTFSQRENYIYSEWSLIT